MTVVAESVVETQTLDNTKVEELFKSDKEVIAEEEAEEKKDEEKKDEEVTEEKNDVKEKKKPVIHKKDFSEDVVYLFQFNRSPQIPSISPLCLQVESWLKLHGIKFENVDLKSKMWSQEGKMLPFIELNGENIVNSDIFENLSNKFEKDFVINLTEDQKKVEEDMIKLVENHLYWAIMHWRCVDYKNLLKGYKMEIGAHIPPAAIKVYFNYTYCRRGLKQVKTSEVGTNTKEEIEQFGKDALKELGEKLGEQKFLFGDDVSRLDLLVFSYVAQIAMVNKEQPCALREFLETDCNNLLELIERVKEKVWGEDWEKATGEKMQMNPHLDGEEQKIVEEEKVEVIKRNRGGTLKRIRGAFDMKKFANAKKVEVEEKEKVEDGEKRVEEDEIKDTEKIEEQEEEAKDKEDSAEEKREDKKKAGTLSRMRGIFDNKKVEKEDSAEEKTEDSPNNEGTLTRMLSIFKKKKHLVEKKKTDEEKTGDEKTTEDKLDDVKDTSEVQEIVTDLVNEIVEEEIVEKEDDSEEKTEDSPNNENTLTRMLSNFMKKKKKKHLTLEEVKDISEEKKETKEESSSESQEIITDIVNEIADIKNVTKESEEL